MNKKDIIILILFIAFLILGACFLFWINGQGAKCIASPLVTGYKQIHPEPISCSCILYDNHVLTFNNESVRIGDNIFITK